MPLLAKWQHNFDCFQLDLLRKFKALPDRYRGLEFVVVIENEAAFAAAPEEASEALGFPIGDTVRAYLSVEQSPESFYFYAQGDVADRLLDMRKGIRLMVKVRTV